MTQEWEIAAGEGMLRVKKYKKGLEIVRYEGEDIYLTIPRTLRLPIEKMGQESDVPVFAKAMRQGKASEKTAAEKSVVSVGKKAMLSCKNLRRVYLPDTIEEVGDWAFAYCDELREVCLPRKEIQFGRGIFRACGKLRSVTVEGNHPDVGGLLAASVTLLNAPYLLSPVSSGDAEWLRRWDGRMLELLRTPDQEGYSKMVLCGEEDYGSRENNLEYFLNQKRQSKVRIAFMRLLHDVGLNGETKEELKEYLRRHTAGSKAAEERNKNGGGEEAQDETWQVLHGEFGDDSHYYRLFTQIGCLTEENFDRILSEAGKDYPEMKAWFLKYKEEKIGYADFFEELLAD